MPPKRKRSGHDDGEDDPPKQFAYLKPQIRRVPEKTIKSKWTTLPEPVQEKVREMFHALERPVVMRQPNEKKRIEAQSAVQAVVRNLGKRLPRMPFPPITKDSNFDYESALDEHVRHPSVTAGTNIANVYMQRTLEANLATIKDSGDLLRAEIAKEEALLANEKKALQQMDKNAKRAEAERKRQTKNEHPVLRRLDDLPQSSRTTEFALVDTKPSQSTLDELDADPEIQGLVKQLHGHLQSMQTNTVPLSGLRDALVRSQAALDLFNGTND
ncbi:CENP-A-nucleosome distal centromere subunit CENP-Q [Penicillium herquei]|nr:CENP-A-nucleosome distal centromere subunit CENP-Q [Penicillium herquei]